MKIRLNDYDIIEHCYEIEIRVLDNRYSIAKAVDGLNEMIKALNKLKEAFNEQ